MLVIIIYLFIAKNKDANITAKPIDTIKEIRESDEEDTTPFKINQNERAKSSHIMRRRHKFVDKVHKLKSSHKCMWINF